MTRMTTRLALALSLALLPFNVLSADEGARPNFGGVYPHLGYFNGENECGTGAVVPWADKLWFVTYGPHSPNGSTDKLYELDSALNLTIRPESVGGTNANRMIHRESNQLFIGNHAIDAEGNVRTMPHKELFGRHTAVARHLVDPANKVYYLTMEEGLYEVDVHTLEVRELWKDGNKPRKPEEDVLPGYHGKGGYTSQGRVVYTNNGEESAAARKDPTVPSGCLAEWLGEEKGWRVVRRNQFTEATGPDGIYGGTGEEGDDAVLWTLGWDVRSVLLMILKDGEWSTYRLPKASHCYDGAHGWNTEWPRIRKIDDENNYLATMHGQFWSFPKDFAPGRARGIRPRSTYLKVIGDWAFWNDRVVFGCDDSAKSEFLNTSPFKTSKTGPGVSGSNLWFVEPSKLDAFGTSIGRGALWLHDSVDADAPSDPYLIGGYDFRDVYYSYEGEGDIELVFEIDRNGTGEWTELKSVRSHGGTYGSFSFPESEVQAEWLRVRSNAPLRNATCFIHSIDKGLKRDSTERFNGLATPEESGDMLGARLWMRADNKRLAVVSEIVKGGELVDERYYELTEDARLERVPCPYEGGEQGTISRVKSFVEPTEPAPEHFTFDDLSALVHYEGKRYRLPIGSDALLAAKSPLVSRLDREVCTERDLFHCAGTFYELPAENAGGFPKIRPIATSDAAIVDYASYRGMLVLAGVSLDASRDSERIVRSEDGQCALWLGTVDDLWELGQARGHGFVWKEERVKEGDVSDPMLATGFDSKTLILRSQSDKPIDVAVEFDPICEGEWKEFQRVTIPANEEVKIEWKEGAPAYWIRVVAKNEGVVTAEFVFN